METSHKIAFVVNPYSGNGKTARRWPKLAEAIQEEIGEFILLKTERSGHATELVQQALRDGYDRIVSVGGDGTHHEVLNGFFDGMIPINPRAAMAILPMGTGSDLARTLNIPKGLKALPYLASDWVTVADLGRVTFTLPEGGQHYLYFINTCHIGFGGSVVERVNRTSKKYGGRLSYFWGLLTTLFTFKQPYLQIDINGNQIDQVCRDLIIAKGQYDGGGMHVAPDAKLDNGLFEIFIIGETTPFEILRNVWRIYKGTLKERPDRVHYFSEARVTARSDEKVLLSIDGEQPGQLPAVIEVMPKAFRIVTASPLHSPGLETPATSPAESAQSIDLENLHEPNTETNETETNPTEEE